LTAALGSTSRFRLLDPHGMQRLRHVIFACKNT